MKKHLFLGSFLLLGSSLFGQTLSSTPSKEKQTIFLKQLMRIFIQVT
jgi:hypothetical protein